ncbi:low molecular weight protein arginine phosphatase [Opitutia bacterium ISCC 51]|nr:low molecular weight protein arginine phosphatase [Opitutae bacterium ISCC 51]QXD26490.1 low molecular weight protein arginine phosphatase [Opitutae bacterium ISCC 52]
MSGRLLFICTGNTCRSPMAERLVQHALSVEAPPLNQLKVRSAGIAAGNGCPASSNSIAALKKVGIDLNDHASTQATEETLLEADLIFAMTDSHLDSVRYHLGDQAEGRIHLMREFMNNTSDQQIPDPFGGGFADYEYTRDSMVEAIPSLIAFLKTKFPAAT